MQEDQNPRANGNVQEFGTDEQLGKLYLAIANAQAEFGAITRTKTVNVRMKDGGGYSFAYAPLEDLLAATRPALAKNGLAVMTPIARDGGDAKIVMILAHKDGGRIVTTFAFPPKPDIKELAGQITYLRRYSYSAMLNLAADDDDDDKGARNITEDRRPTGQVHQRPPGRGSQPSSQGAGANSSRAMGPTPQADGDLPPMIADAGDPDYVWMLRVQEAAKDVGIPTSTVKLPTRRMSLLSTANSLLNAVNNARLSRNMSKIERRSSSAPMSEDPYGGSEDGQGGEGDIADDMQYATPDQVEEIDTLVTDMGIPILVDPETEEAWVIEDTDYLLLSRTEAERMLTLLRGMKQSVA